MNRKPRETLFRVSPSDRILTPAEIRAILQAGPNPAASPDGEPRPEALDVIILDHNRVVAEMLRQMVERFYSWGRVHAVTTLSEARRFCLERDSRVAIFILDVYLENETGLSFVESLVSEYPLAAEDTVAVAGVANDEIVEKCLELGISHLLEKPVSRHGLELAVRSVVAKYTNLLKILSEDPDLEELVKGIG